MNNPKRGVLFSLLLVLALANASCSFINSFIVINASGTTLKVRYHVKDPRDPRFARLKESGPLTMPRSDVGKQGEWQPLSSARYTVDADARVVVLTLDPNEALRLTQCTPAYGAYSVDCKSEEFDVDEIELYGTNGELRVTGEQAHKIFVQDENTYTLTYHRRVTNWT